MNAPGSPRFRFRTPEGTEVPVASVEELSSRLEKGELGSETPLFDAGTGTWNRAGDVPVFQFVREELRAEGRLPDDDDVEMMVLPDPPPEEPIDPGVDFEPIEHGTVTSRPLAPPTVDPFELHLPLSNPLDPMEGQMEAAGEGRGDGSGEGEGGSPRGGGVDDPGGRAGDAGLAEGPEDGEDGSGEAGQEPLREPWFEDRALDDMPSGREGPGLEAERADAGAGAATGENADPATDPATDRATDRATDPVAEPGTDPGIDSSPLHAWLTHGPPTPAVPSPPRRQDDSRSPGSEAESADGPEGAAPRGGDGVDRRGDSTGPFPPTTGPGGGSEAGAAAAPVSIRTAWEDDEAGEDPRALRLRSRRRQRNARLTAGLAALVIVGVGGAAIYSAVRVPDAAPNASPGATGEAGVATPAPTSGFAALEGVDLPDRLEGAAAAVWAALPGEVSLLVDSLRMDAGLADAPPRAWLGGYYLANAGEFSDVVVFWTEYGAFVEALAARDSWLLRHAGERAMDLLAEGGSGLQLPTPVEELGADDREEILNALEARHARSRGAREDRYLHLQRTAEAALALHAFLVQNEEAIAYSPALGQGVSADPVLEAVTNTPAIRRQMEQNLDRIFMALDRTRGGGQPSLVGLRTELFGSLGRPL